MNEFSQEARENDRIVTYFTNRILSGELVSGSKLPSEGDLGVQFSASRTVVREAIQQLKARGVVETINGLTSFHSHPRGGRKRRHGTDNYWPTPRQKSTEATHFRSQFQGRFPAPKMEPCV